MTRIVLSGFGVLFLVTVLATSTVCQTGQLDVRDDRSQVSEDVGVRIMVLRNDMTSGVAWDTATLEVVDPPNDGIAVVEEGVGRLIYRPRTNFHGLDSLSYRVCDKSGSCGRAQVIVLVHGVNDTPVASNDRDTVLEDQSILLEVIHNDQDQADQALVHSLTIDLVKAPIHGIAEKMEGGAINYIPNPHYFGNDYLLYSLCDESLCDTAMAQIHVLAQNDVPVIRDDSASTYQDILAVINVMDNDNDSLDLQPLDHESLQIVQSPAHGEAFVDNIGWVIYVPQGDFVGVDTMAYEICDLGPDPIHCVTGTIMVEVLPALARGQMVEGDGKPIRVGLNLNTEKSSSQPSRETRTPK